MNDPSLEKNIEKPFDFGLRTWRTTRCKTTLTRFAALSLKHNGVPSSSWRNTAQNTMDMVARINGAMAKQNAVGNSVLESIRKRCSYLSTVLSQTWSYSLQGLVSQKQLYKCHLHFGLTQSKFIASKTSKLRTGACSQPYNQVLNNIF